MLCHPLPMRSAVICDALRLVFLDRKVASRTPCGGLVGLGAAHLLSLFPVSSSCKDMSQSSMQIKRVRSRPLCMMTWRTQQAQQRFASPVGLEGHYGPEHCCISSK